MAELVKICAWCLPDTVRFLDGEGICLAPGESLQIEWDERKGVQIFVISAGISRALRISHGICSDCSKTLRTEGSVKQ